MFATAALGVDGGAPAPAGAKGLVAHGGPVAHAAAAFDPIVKTQSFTAEDLREFDRLLDQDGQLTPRAIAFWFGRGKLVDPTTGKPLIDSHWLKPAVGAAGSHFEPVGGYIVFKLLPQQHTLTNPTIWRVKTNLPGRGLSNRFIIKSTKDPKDCETEAKKLENFNKEFPAKDWAGMDLPDLARPIDSLVYHGPGRVLRCFIFQEAAQGVQVGRLPKNLRIDGQSSKDFVAHALGKLHFHFLEDKAGKEPVESWRTVVHGDFHDFNVFYDATTGKLTLIDLGAMAANRSIHRDVQGLRATWRVLDRKLYAIEKIAEEMSDLEKMDQEAQSEALGNQYSELGSDLDSELQGFESSLGNSNGVVASYVSAYPRELRAQVEEYLSRLFLKGYRGLGPDDHAKKVVDSLEAEWKDRIRKAVGQLKGRSNHRTLPPVAVVARAVAGNLKKVFSFNFSGVDWKVYPMLGGRPDPPTAFVTTHFLSGKNGARRGFQARYAVDGKLFHVEAKTPDCKPDPEVLQKASGHNGLEGTYWFNASDGFTPERVSFQCG